MFALLPLLVGCGDYLYVEKGAERAPIGEVQVVDLAEATSLNHYAAAGLLAHHVVVEEGAPAHLFEYEEINARVEATATLQAVLGQYAGVDPSALESREERLAFWLNLYNFAVLDAVARRLAVDPDFTDHEVDGWSLFDEPTVQVGGHRLTLNLLEHGLMRGTEYALEYYVDPDQEGQRELVEQWHQELWEGKPVDPRIHMALVCASYGCPNLPVTPLWAPDLDTHLDALAVAYVDDDRKGAGPDGVSEIFFWFSSEFEETHGSVEGFVETYRTGGADDVDFETRLPYDWTVNAAASR